jgi:hypothetical protein
MIDETIEAQDARPGRRVPFHDDDMRIVGIRTIVEVRRITKKGYFGRTYDKIVWVYDDGMEIEWFPDNSVKVLVN